MWRAKRSRSKSPVFPRRQPFPGLHRAQVREHRDARHELHDERPPRRQVPEHGRHAFDGVVGGVAPEPIRVPRLAPVVELLDRPRREFVHRLECPEQRRDTQPANEAHREADEADVPGKLDVDRRTLDLHGDLLAAQIRHVHLPDRRGRERLGVELVEELRRRASQLLEEDLLDVRERERRDAIEQVEELVAVFDRQDVRLQREHLPELDEASAQVLEEPAKPLRTGELRQGHAPDEPRPPA